MTSPPALTSLRQGERAERLLLSLAPPTGTMRFFKRAQQLQATQETSNSSTVELPMPENEMHQLSQEVSNLRANLGRARAHFNTLRGALSQKDKSLHEMLHQLEIHRSEEKLKERDELLRRSQADLVVAQEMAREHGTEAERLGAEAAELSVTVRDLYANQEAQQTEVDTLRHEALELQQRLQETNTCFEETANSLEQQHERAELSQEELVAMQARLGEHKAECERMLQNEKRRAEEELDNTRGKMEFIKAELGVSRAEEAAAAQEVVRLQYAVHYADAEMNFMRGQIDGLQHQLFENNNQMGSLQAGILDYQRVVGELHAALAPSHENLQSLHAQLQDLQVLHQQSEAKCGLFVQSNRAARGH
ncbi:unnamed protein product [Lampetra planeri]